MKKLFSVFFALLFLVSPVFLQTVYAAEDSFDKEASCDQVLTGKESVGSITENRQLWKLWDSADNNELRKEWIGKLCIFKDAITNRSVINGINEHAGLVEEEVYYCRSQIAGQDYVIGVEQNNNTYANRGGANEHRNICCPAAKPYIYRNNYEWWNVLYIYVACCEAPGIVYNGDPSILFRDPRCAQDMKVVEWDRVPKIYDGTEDNPVFFPPTDLYTCHSNGCINDGGAISAVDPNGYILSEAQRLTCLQPGEEIIANPDPKIGTVCWKGGSLTKEEYTEIGPIAIEACEKLSPDPNNPDRKACKECFDRSKDSSTTFVYSSLGCIDTSQSGIITRLFQIGVGIIGGVMILQFIYAAFLRQSADPTKIQEGNDRITSAIIALIVLVGAVVLLRFLGIRVLNILPESFLL